MEEIEKNQPNMQKSILSIILLLALLMGLIYAAPMLTDRLRENSEKEKAEGAEAVNVLEQPQTSSELEAWIPLVTRQFPKYEDGSAKFTLLHMRLNEAKSELLLDMKEGVEGIPFDLILIRDQFGRYVSSDEGFTIKLYPPEG